MENDKQIKEIVSKSKDQFLAEELLPKLEKTTAYSLPKEFSRAGKNRNTLSNIALIIYIFLIAAATIGITLYIQEQNRKVDVAINDFETLNLTEMITEAKKNIDALAAAKEERDDLRFDYNNDILKAKERASAEKDIILNQNLGKEDRQKELAKIKKRESISIARARSKYLPRIEEKEKEIEKLDETVSKYNDDLIESAKKGDAMLSGYQKIHEIKMEKQKKKYEKKIREIFRENAREMQETRVYYSGLLETLKEKYNPTFDKEKVVKEIEKEIPEETNQPIRLTVFTADILGTNMGLLKTKKKEIANMINSYQTLTERMYEIPYTNSVPKALRRIDYYTRTLFHEMAMSMREDNDILNRYKNAFTHYARDNRDAGYILYANSENDIEVFIYEIFEVKKGDTALVFRGDNEYIGKIILYPTKKRVLAKVSELPESNAIKPFDKVLVAFTGERTAFKEEDESTKKKAQTNALKSEKTNANELNEGTKKNANKANETNKNINTPSNETNGE